MCAGKLVFTALVWVCIDSFPEIPELHQRDCSICSGIVMDTAFGGQRKPLGSSLA